MIKGTTLPRSISYVFLVSTGRSGTTLLMRILSAHPQLLVRSVFPYETRAMQYYFSSWKNGCTNAHFEPIEESGARYLPFQGDDTVSKAWRQGQTSAAVGKYGLELSGQYYQMVAEAENKTQPIHAVEKTIGWTLANEIMGAVDSTRAIALFRDPRDVYLSIKSFNKKRGYLSFGEEHGDEVMLRKIVRNFKTAQRKLERTQGRVFEVRYESVVSDPEEAITRVYSLLGVDTDEGIVQEAVKSAFEDDSQNVRYHKTSGRCVQNSIHRWERDADDEALELFKKNDLDFQMIGY